jgi:hypothetical protein
MKKRCFFLLFFIWISPIAHADMYVKGLIHVKGGYRYGHNVPDMDAVNEWWFSRDKFIFISTGWQLDYLFKDWRFMLDRAGGKILAVNISDGFYVEASSSADPFSLVERQWIGRLKNYVIDGNTREAGINESVLQRASAVFEVTEWIEEGKDHFYERDRTVKTTSDVPFDWRMADELYQWIRSFFNPRPAYVSDLRKMSGFILEEEVRMYELAGQVECSFRVVEIAEKKAPPDLWGVPDGFKKKDHLSFRDLREMLSVIYPEPIY